MSHSTTTFAQHYVTTLATMCQAATKQQRTASRLLLLTVGLVLVAGRSMLSRVVLVLGLGARDWTAWYRLFNQRRIDLSALRRQLVAQWVGLVPEHEPLVLVVDATQLPRTGRKMPGAGFARNPRTPAWFPGIHHAQRWEGVSGLTPATVDGDCRAIPLWFEPAAPEQARPWPGQPPRKEWEAALDGINWVRRALVAVGAAQRQLLVVGDGSYSTSPMWRGLPAGTTLIARCIKNRALFQLPGTQASRGRKRRYGERERSPQEQLQQPGPWSQVVVRVRGKDRHVRVRLAGPYLVKPAPDCPLFLITVAGIDRTVGRRTRSRDAMHFLVNAARQSDGSLALPFPLEDLIHWLWQRWEVEVMHRELKSGWGLGDQQQWSAAGAALVTGWVVWAYGVMLAVGCGLGADRSLRPTTKWYRGRRWTPRDLTMAVRQSIWTVDHKGIQRLCARFEAKPPKITALEALLATMDAL